MTLAHALLVASALVVTLGPLSLPHVSRSADRPSAIGPWTAFASSRVLQAESCIGTRWRDTESAVSAGVIRWDAWWGSRFERNLDPEQWHPRVPFYGMLLSPSLVRVRSDSGVVMDQEIGFAASAGLTYWAFDYYHPKAFSTADSYNYGLRQYLSSPCRDEINFSLLLLGRWVGPPAEWPATISGFVDLLRGPGYQMVAGGRPLVYFFDIEPMQELFGSWAQARIAVDDLRAAARLAGLKDPYIVGLAGQPSRAAELADILGFDAIGAYSASCSSGPGGRAFEELRQANETFWSDAAATGKEVVPPMSVGWDPRPRLADESLSQALWYQEPEPVELAEHVNRAMLWAEATDPRTVLLYAWNEHDEGGWLTPTLSEGAARLDAIEQALREVHSDRLVSGARLLPGQSLRSSTGRYRLLYQSDGNLVMYDDVDRTAPWASHTAGTGAGRAVMQGDENFVVYDALGSGSWATSTTGNTNAYLTIQDDGNLVVYRSDGQAVWNRFSAPNLLRTAP